MIEMKTVKILAAFVLLLMVGTAAAGISMDVKPITPTVGPGGTATYEVNISYFVQPPPTEHVVLSIDNLIPGWTYTFNPNGFDINTGESKDSTLSITAPADAQPGTYSHTITATATGQIGPIPIVEIVTTEIETELIPEFSTIAVPVVAVIGLLLLMRRRKE
jgi:uncharacterized membrane protein